jgi:glycine betaine/choline ABC-type transport system substrate-binding protein
MVDRFGATMTTVPKFSTLNNISTEEAIKRLDALKQEREQLFRSAQLNPNAYENTPASQNSQRIADRERILCLKDLRISVRDGNTTGLFTRYLQHQNRVNQKNAPQDLQAQNDGLNRNNEVQQAKQNPEASGVQMG